MGPAGPAGEPRKITSLATEASGHRLVAGRQVAGVRLGRLPRVHDQRVQRAGAEEVRGRQEQGARLRPPDVPALGLVEGGPVQPPVRRAVGRFRRAARRDARRGRRAAVLAGRPRGLRLLAGLAASWRSHGRPTRSRRSAPTATCSSWTSRNPSARAAGRSRRTRRPTAGRSTRRTAATSPTARSTAPGFEADRWQLMLYDRKTGEHRSTTVGLGPLARQLRVVARLEDDLPHRRERRAQRHLPPAAGRRRPRCRSWRRARTASCKLSRDGKTLVFTPEHADRAVGAVRGAAERQGGPGARAASGALTNANPGLAGFKLREGRERDVRGRRRHEDPGVDGEAARLP